MELDGAKRSAAQPLAGAASASDASDASFLRRSVLAFLLAVIAVGVLFWWFRGRQAPPTRGGAPIADVPATSTPAPEPQTLPADAAAVGETPSAASPEAAGSAAAGESSAGSPAAPAGLPATEPPATAPPATPVAEPPPAAAGTEPAASPSPEPPAVAPSAAEQDPAAIVEAVEQRVKAWAAAWSEQQVDAYMDCYAPDFSPPRTSRRVWQQQRAARIRAPASILVQAKDISVEVVDASRARATFYQDYETDTKQLYTWKTMELARLPGGWKIVRERVGR